MIVALDLETTWVDPKNDAIIEFAGVKFDEKTFEVIEVFSTLINPWIPIPEIVSNITDIFDKDVKDAPLFDDEMRKKITQFIGKNPILWHNTPFDRDFLISHHVDVEDNIILDTFELANMCFPYERSLNLWNLCETFGITLTWAHRALNDTYATIELFKYITKFVKKLKKSQKQILSSILTTCNQPSFLMYRDLLWLQDFYISQEKCTQNILSYSWKYIPKQKASASSLELDKKDPTEFFAFLPNTEIRENQMSMTQRVKDAFFGNKKILIEAPTWVGKTFAYMIPALQKTLTFWEKVVITTHTKALQDQIFYKDLEFLKTHLPYEFFYAKLKWKKNYLSITRYIWILWKIDQWSRQEIILYLKIAFWISQTTFWEFDEINLYPWEYRYLDEINADHFFVLSDKNDLKHHEYYFKARSEASTSDILIVNHSLFLQEAFWESSLFWDIQTLVIDEAHNLEDVATESYFKRFSQNFLQETFEKIKKLLQDENFTFPINDKQLEHCINQVHFLFDMYSWYAFLKNPQWNNRFQVLIEDDFFIQNWDIQTLYKDISHLFDEIYDVLHSLPDHLYSVIKTPLLHLQEIGDILQVNSKKESQNDFIMVFSIENDGQHTLWYTLLFPGKYLKKYIWDKIPSILCTSATLEINGSFDYLSQSLCLEDFETLILKSDFDYAKQALLFVPNDLWSIKYSNPFVVEFLISLFLLIWWNALALFTSFQSIKEIYLASNMPLKQKNISLLAQWVWGSKHKIANHFISHAESSIILWTDSFWEWIDIPWNKLKYLIIHKFPFMVPVDPIFKARSRLFQDPFWEYSIPKAILKTKQWFGRLIRSKTDTGVVILLDDRIYSTKWGKALIASFPDDIKIKYGNSKEFLAILEKNSHLKEWR